MSPSLQNNQRRNAPSKSCTVSGCGGTMILHGRQETAGEPQGLEGGSGATWVCDNNPTHLEGVTAAEEQG